MHCRLHPLTLHWCMTQRHFSCASAAAPLLFHCCCSCKQVLHAWQAQCTGAALQPAARFRAHAGTHHRGRQRAQLTRKRSRVQPTTAQQFQLCLLFVVVSSRHAVLGCGCCVRTCCTFFFVPVSSSRQQLTPPKTVCPAAFLTPAILIICHRSAQISLCIAAPWLAA
jgi:hypothetical protein